MRALVLIEKISSSEDFWPKLIKAKKIPELSVQEIINKYQGIEGELIFMFSIKEDDAKLKEIIDQYLEVTSSNSYLLLFAFSEPDTIPSFLKKQAIQVGYDVGIALEEEVIYSSIHNEILFGYYEELISYKNLLNENLLFPDRSTAEKYVNLYNEMSAEGKGVEDYNEIYWENIPDLHNPSRDW